MSRRRDPPATQRELSPHLLDLRKDRSREQSVRKSGRQVPASLEPPYDPEGVARIDFTRSLAEAREDNKAPRRRERNRIRSLLAFLALIVVLIIPIKIAALVLSLEQTKGKVLGEASQALGAFSQGQDAYLSGNPEDSRTSFAKAANLFADAAAELEGYQIFLRSAAAVLPREGATYAAAYDLLQAGESLSRALASLQGTGTGATVDRVGDLDLLSGVATWKETSAVLLPSLQQANSALARVELGVLPKEFQEQFRELKGNLPPLVRTLQRFSASHEVLGELVGAQGLRRYLFVFQNSNELRPTGGFLGSLALVDIQGGRVKNIEIPLGGSYDVAGQLDLRIQPPAPLTRVTQFWNIQDANWYPDFPTSARKIMWFYERAGGRSVDGVVAVNARVLEELLRVVGSVELPEYGLTLTPDNAIRMLEEEIETGEEKAQSIPKRILAELFPMLLERSILAGGTQAPLLLPLLLKAFLRKDVMLYLGDREAQSLVASSGWDGSIKGSDAFPPPERHIQDFLMVVDTNIGGGKTDGVVEELIDHEAEIGADGQVTVTVQVSRVHRGSPEDPLRGRENVDYLRVYVPKGSVLLESSGFSAMPSSEFKVPPPEVPMDAELLSVEQHPFLDERTGTRITEEFGKTVFGNWVRVVPGEGKVVRFRYVLPGRVIPASPTSSFLSFLTPVPGATYEAFIQNQPGVRNRFYASHLLLPSSAHPMFASSGVATQCPAASSTECVVGSEGVLEGDLEWGLHWQ